jgi:hypothetical protein
MAPAKGKATNSAVSQTIFVFANINPIPRYFFNNKLTDCISFCGLDVTRFKSHSLRIGGASHYANLGYSDSQIRVLGRWKSDAFKKYIRGQRIYLPGFQ